MNSGYFPVFRKIQDNFVWQDNELLAIWIRILMRANINDKEWFDGSDVITIKRGSFVTTARDFGKLILKPKTTAMRRAELFQKQQMLEIQVGHKWDTDGTNIGRKVGRNYLIITVCNYEKYWDAVRNAGTQDGTQVGHKWDTDGTSIRSKEVKEVKNKPRTIDDFSSASEEHPPYKGNGSKPKKKTILRPDDVPESVWEDFLALRKEKRAPVTETAMNGLRMEGDKAGYTLTQVLETCCLNGWQGFKASWVTKKNDPGTGKPNTLNAPVFKE